MLPLTRYLLSCLITVLITAIAPFLIYLQLCLLIPRFNGSLNLIMVPAICAFSATTILLLFTIPLDLIYRHVLLKRIQLHLYQAFLLLTIVNLVLGLSIGLLCNSFILYDSFFYPASLMFSYWFACVPIMLTGYIFHATYLAVKSL